MNWTRNMRLPRRGNGFASLYRREPITAFMLTAGLVDALIGGTGGYQTLLAIGLGTAGLAIGIRWKLMQQTRRKSPSQTESPSTYESKYQSRRARFLPDSDAHLVTIDVDARKV